MSATRKPPGSDRRVGVEIEFAGLLPDESAKIVAATLGGTAKQTDLYCWSVGGTGLGEFYIELDTQYVKAGNNPLQEAIEGANEKLGRDLRRLIGSASEGLVPTEIVSPPIPLDKLPAMDRLAEALRDAGAEDNTSNPLNAFGLHLNPDVTGTEVDDILPTLKAYLLMSAWLRQEIGIDLARRALPYIDPFPESYAKRVTDTFYTPDMATLIDDYLSANDTRNRELDMLPLFAHLDEKRVRACVDDPRIKPRPTYHYRLPEARLSAPDWSISQEWERWTLVEAMAGEDDALLGLAALYHDTPSRDWAKASTRFIKDWRSKRNL